VLISDDNASVLESVMRAVTDPQKVRRSDPGHPEVCNVFAYHRVFSPSDEVACIERDCRSGVLGCVEDKRRLARTLQQLIEPFRERRAMWERRPDDVWDVLMKGTARACEEGQHTLDLVRAAMSIKYW